MSRSEHPSYGGRLSRALTAAAEQPATSEPADACATTWRYADRACCCAAQPAVVAVLPTRSGGRQTETDLLLCGHHYRASKAALAAVGATILDMRGGELAGDWPGDAR